jgi:hypothetical protein
MLFDKEKNINDLDNADEYFIQMFFKENEKYLREILKYMKRQPLECEESQVIQGLI